MRDTKAQFEQVIAECRDLYVKKLHDYGAAWRIMRPASVTDQIFIKANRIKTLEVKGVSMVGEGIKPEFMGIVDMPSMRTSVWSRPSSCMTSMPNVPWT